MHSVRQKNTFRRILEVQGFGLQPTGLLKLRSTGDVNGDEGVFVVCACGDVGVWGYGVTLVIRFF
jgi:hypothetical protein